MAFQIVPLAEPHFEALHGALGAVASEGRYLAFTAAPPLADSLAYYRSLLAGAGVSSVVLIDGRLVGWCDVTRAHGEARAHVGSLGIGLLAQARQRGIGQPLMATTITRAWALGLTRIELGVRADNLNAKALYERLGFVTEGVNRQAFHVDGVYHDACAMALIK